MPEIPFVQTLVDNLRPQVQGRVLAEVGLRSPSLLKTFDPPLESLAGAAVRDAARRGKVVLLEFSNDLVLVFHMMRDGRFQLVPSSRRPSKDVSLVLRFSEGPDLRMIELGPKKRAAGSSSTSSPRASAPSRKPAGSSRSAGPRSMST